VDTDDFLKPLQPTRGCRQPAAARTSTDGRWKPPSSACVQLAWVPAMCRQDPLGHARLRSAQYILLLCAGIVHAVSRRSTPFRGGACGASAAAARAASGRSKAGPQCPARGPDGAPRGRLQGSRAAAVSARRQAMY